jgi:phosphoribosyl-AMP cyclohydrolase
MFAWMNQESLSLTIEKQQAVYYSRSRKKLWFKGEESGHTQFIECLRCSNTFSNCFKISLINIIHKWLLGPLILC